MNMLKGHLTMSFRHTQTNQFLRAFRVLYFGRSTKTLHFRAERNLSKNMKKWLAPGFQMKAVASGVEGSEGFWLRMRTKMLLGS